MKRIAVPGIYPDISDADYHADCVAVPSLSSSIAKILIDQSPRHGWLAHPRLNPKHEPKNSKDFDIGTAAHALLLEGSEAKIVHVEANDYRTDAAKARRDAAYEAGNVPLLTKQIGSVRAMVKAARAQLAHHQEASEAFDQRLGKPEQTGIWAEPNGSWCRMRIDWLPNDGNVVYDYKSTGSANPEDWLRIAYGNGADVQAAFYRRGLRALTGRDYHFRWIVQEVEEPYAISVCELDPASIAMADRKVEAAINFWGWCIEHDAWPGYPNRVAYLTAPVWQERRWLEREDRTKLVADMGEDERAFLLNWQAPPEETK